MGTYELPETYGSENYLKDATRLVKKGFKKGELFRAISRDSITKL